MLKKTSLITILALTAAFASSGCGAKKNPVKFGTSNPNALQKGTVTDPQITTVNDQLLMAFDELGWVRQSAALSINPPSLQAQEGCVLRTPIKGARFLTETFECTRTSDTSDSAANRRFEFRGSQNFEATRGYFQINGLFAKKTYALATSKTPETLVSQGSITRQVSIVTPTGVPGSSTQETLLTTVYKMTANMVFQGNVPAESKNQPEMITSSLQGGFTATSTLPLSIITGTALAVSYLPEVEQDVKRGAQIVNITATSDIQWLVQSLANSNCLRPVGTFAWTITQGGISTTGNLTTTVAGYTRADEGTVHPWDARCLER